MKNFKKQELENLAKNFNEKELKKQLKSLTEMLTSLTSLDLSENTEIFNKRTFNGLAVLPYDNGSYTQAPFEDITEEIFLKMESHLNNIDLTKIIETTDETKLQDQAACAGGNCEIV